MARLPRLSIAGHAHWLTQRGHSGSPVFADAADRSTFLGALKDAAVADEVQVHAYALLDNEVHLLATPATAFGISRMMQSLGRRYVSAYRRRHGGSGTLWDGRFRCAVVEAGATLLDVMCLIDSLAGQAGLATEPGASSLVHRSGSDRNSLLVDPQAYWLSGNTPFDRQAAWRKRVGEGLSDARASALRAAARGGWAVGSAAFAASVGEQAARPATPRPRGRPRSRPE